MRTKDINGTVLGKPDVTAPSLQKFQIRRAFTEGTKISLPPERLGEQRSGSFLLISVFPIKCSSLVVEEMK